MIETKSINLELDQDELYELYLYCVKAKERELSRYLMTRIIEAWNSYANNNLDSILDEMSPSARDVMYHIIKESFDKYRMDENTDQLLFKLMCILNPVAP